MKKVKHLRSARLSLLNGKRLIGKTNFVAKGGSHSLHFQEKLRATVLLSDYLSLFSHNLEKTDNSTVDNPGP